MTEVVIVEKPSNVIQVLTQGPSQGGGGGGVTAHSALTGLGNDDHLQYTLTAEAQALVDAGVALATQRANHSGTQSSATITDFTEAAQDVIGALLVDSATVDFTYNDAGNAETVAVIDSPKVGGIAVSGTPSAGQVPTATGSAAATWQTPAGGGGWAFGGDGSDGAFTADGAAAMPGATLASNVYTLTRDVYFTNLTVNNGVTIKSANYRIFFTILLTNNGTISNDGISGVAGGGGASTAAGTIAANKAGGAGGVGATAGVAGAGSAFSLGGSGGRGNNATQAGGVGGVASLVATYGSPRNIWQALSLLLALGSTKFDAGASAGGGAGAAAGDTGGGGGASGSILGLYGPSIVNNGSIQAKGGNGGNAGGVNAGGGGGGGGGAIVIVTRTAVTGTGSMSVAGGAVGANIGSPSGAASTPGSTGTIYTILTG